MTTDAKPKRGRPKAAGAKSQLLKKRSPEQGQAVIFRTSAETALSLDRAAEAQGMSRRAFLEALVQRELNGEHDLPNIPGIDALMEPSVQEQIEVISQANRITPDAVIRNALGLVIANLRNLRRI